MNFRPKDKGGAWWRAKLVEERRPLLPRTAEYLLVSLRLSQGACRGKEIYVSNGAVYVYRFLKWAWHTTVNTIIHVHTACVYMYYCWSSN